MEFYPTKDVCQPHSSVKTNVWNQFIHKFPLSSKEFFLPKTAYERYQLTTAIMFAKILDVLVSEQQQMKLNEICQSLGEAAKNYPQFKQHIVKLVEQIKTLLTQMEPFNGKQLQNQQYIQQINIVDQYLLQQRNYIYSLFQSREGREKLCFLWRGVVLCLYLQTEYKNLLQIQNFLSPLSREQVIEKLTNNAFDPTNQFIVEDYEIVAISHLLNLPIHFYINYCKQQENSLIVRRIHQNQSVHKTLCFFLNCEPQQSIRILQKIPNYFYVQDIIKLQQDVYPYQFQKLISLITNLLNQVSHDFVSMNQLWMQKIIENIKSEKASVIIGKIKSIQLNDVFKRDCEQLFQVLDLNQSAFNEFINISEEQFKQTQDLMETVIIKQLTELRNQLNRVYQNDNKQLASGVLELHSQQQHLKKTCKLKQNFVDQYIPAENDFNEIQHFNQLQNQYIEGRQQLSRPKVDSQLKVTFQPSRIAKLSQVKLQQGNPSIQKVHCPICFNEINSLSEIKSLHDDHKVCGSCLQDWIKVKFSSGQWNFKFFKCPIQRIEGNINKPCDHIIDQSEIKNALTPEEFQTLTEKAMKNGIIDITCPNESCLAHIKGMPSQNQIGFHCPQCKQKICWVCKRSDHGEMKCPKRLEDIKNALLDERISCCPNCLEIYLKSEGCNHVVCANCFVDFCFVCCAPREPMLVHGAHYHRVGCEQRKPWIDPQTNKERFDEEFDATCEQCMTLQKACPRPMALDQFRKLAHLNF